MIVYEVTVEIETALFARSQIVRTVQSMGDVVALQRVANQKKYAYKFISYRGPIALSTAHGVYEDVAAERAEQARIAGGL